MGGKVAPREPPSPLVKALKTKDYSARMGNGLCNGASAFGTRRRVFGHLFQLASAKTRTSAEKSLPSAGGVAELADAH